MHSQPAFAMQRHFSRTPQVSTRLRWSGRALLWLIALEAGLAAQTPSWQPIVTPIRPYAAAWDSARGTTVLLTYQGISGGLRHWEWNGVAAGERLGTFGGLLAAPWIGDDPVHGRLVAVATDKAGTWDGARWTWQSFTPVVSISSSSPARCAFDVGRGCVVVYQPYGGTNDVHEWDGTQWRSLVNTPGPVPRTGAAFAYDPNSQRCIMYGGFSFPTFTFFDDCWAWDGSAWTQIAASAPPGSRMGASMQYSPTLGSLVLYGGSSATTTWRLVGNVWTQVPTANNPGLRSQALLVPDSHGLLLVGDLNDPLGAAWRFTGVDWTAVGTFVTPMQADTVAIDRVRNQAVLYSPNNPTTQLFDTQWHGTSPATIPPSRPLAQMCWSSIEQQVLLFGGWDLWTGAVGDTWSWSGTDWMQRNPAQSPAPRYGGMVAEDPSGGVLLFGGYNGTSFFNDHWHWNGSQWQNVMPATLPPGPGHHAALDPIRGRVLMLIVPNTATIFAWEWDGTNWNQVASPPPMLFMGPRSIAFDPRRGRIVTASLPGFEWTATTWTMFSPDSRATNLTPIGFVDDRSRGRLLGFRYGPVHHGAMQLSDWPSSVTVVGSGCAIGESPVLHALQQPTLGNTSFVLEVGTLAPGSPALLAFGFTAQSLPLGGGCALLVGQYVASVILVAQPGGQARNSVPIPNDPSLRGVQFIAQAAVFDPARSPLGSVTLTQGLLVTVGD